MLSFYGELTCKLPCVICDAGLHVLFANKTAYGDPITVKWIDEGKPSFGKALIAAMENAFEAEPFGIARLDYTHKGKRRTVLADRRALCGATVYAFAVLGDDGNAAKSELDGRRMLTACFSPTIGRLAHNTPFNSEITDTWARLASDVAERAGKRLDISCDISDTGTPVKSCEALLCSASAVLAAYCGNAKGDISVSIREERFGISFSFRAEAAERVDASLISSESAALISACFAHSGIPMLVAIQTATEGGISLIADTMTDTELAVTLRMSSFDIGDCGFKASAEALSNAKAIIYAVTEMLI